MKDYHKDPWLKLFCPDDTCLTEEERIFIPESEETEAIDQWQKIFCPDNSCDVNSPSQLP